MKNPRPLKEKSKKSYCWRHVAFETQIDGKEVTVEASLYRDHGSYWDPPHQEAEIAVKENGNDITDTLEEWSETSSLWQRLEEEAWEASSEIEAADMNE